MLTAATAGPWGIILKILKEEGFRQRAQPRPLYSVTTSFFLLIPMGRSSNTKDSNSDEAAEVEGYQKDRSAWSQVC